MPKEIFEVCFQVPSNKLGTILEVVRGTATLMSVRALPAPPPAQRASTEAPSGPLGPPRKRPPRRHGTGAVDVVIRALVAARRPLSRDDVQRALAEAGYSPTSYSPTCTKLEREGKIKRLANLHIGLAGPSGPSLA